jgi:hypothetical protein
MQDLDAEHLAGLKARTLSVLVNDNGGGTHGFKFFGQRNFKSDVALEAQTLMQEIEKARAGLRIVAWGDNKEPDPANAEASFRFSAPTRDQLVQAILVLARTGFQLYDLLADPLGGDQASELRQSMRRPGRVEFANRTSLDLLVPAACVYDYPMRWQSANAVCGAFLDALGKRSLSETECFTGACPTYADTKVVCPSGFWGFRHEIGYAASLSGGAASDAKNQSSVIGCSPSLVFNVAASADAHLTRRDEHLRTVAALTACQWEFAPTATGLLDLFSSSSPSIAYLYGHGGVDEAGRPYFVVGTDEDGPIYRADLRDRVDWRKTHPLVFLNGCHSAALSPNSAFTYATGFLQTSHASAVVGSEIAIAESLAVAFGEECLRRFVVDLNPLGQAVREARLALLAKNNPLGLAYLAFGPAEVRLGLPVKSRRARMSGADST